MGLVRILTAGLPTLLLATKREKLLLIAKMAYIYKTIKVYFEYVEQ